MKRKIVIIALMALLPWISTHAQDTIPHIKGKLAISVKKGTFECDLVNIRLSGVQSIFPLVCE